MPTVNIGDNYGTTYKGSSFHSAYPASYPDSIIWGPVGIARLRGSTTADYGAAFMYNDFSSIPAGSIVTSATHYFRVRHTTAGTHTWNIYANKTTTNFLTLSEAILDVAVATATEGQPTYRRSKDYNGAGGDAYWGGGGNWTLASDAYASAGSVTTSSWVADTNLSISCTAMVADWVSGAVENKGYFGIPSSAGSELYIYSYLSANAANPYFSVTYTTPSNIFLGMDF